LQQNKLKRHEERGDNWWLVTRIFPLKGELIVEKIA